MANNRLILRTLNSPWTTPVADIRKGTVLTHEDVDNNFIYVRGELIYNANIGTGLDAGNIVLSKINGGKLLIPFSGGTDYFVTGGTYDNATALITLTRNDANSVIIDLSTLKAYVDSSVTGLTTDNITQGSTNFYITDGDKGDVTVSNSGQTWTVNDDALKYTTGTTLVGNIIYFDRNDSLSAYTTDLSSIISGISADTYTTGTTLIGNVIYFDRTDGLGQYNVDLTSIVTGITSQDTYTTGSTLIGNTIYFDDTDTLSAYTTDLTSLVDSLTLTDGNGITIGTGNTIDLGGALTQSATTIIGSGSEDITFGGTAIPTTNSDNLNTFGINSTVFRLESLNTFSGGSTDVGTTILVTPGEFSSTNYVNPVIRSQIINGSSNANLWVSSNKIFRLYLDSSGGGIAPGSGESFTINGTIFTEGIDFTGQGNYLLDAATIAGLTYTGVTNFVSVADEGSGSIKFEFSNPAMISETLTDGNFLEYHWDSSIETSNSGVIIKVGDDDFYGTPGTILTIGDKETIFTDNSAIPKGIQYAANYDTTLVDDSLVPKRYVDNAITGVTDNFTTGTTLVGTTLYFDTKNSLSAYTADLSSLGGGGTANTYTTAATLIGTDLYFDRTDASSAYTVDLSSIVNGVSDGNKGDITVSNSGTTWTINDSSLKYTTGTTLVGTTLYFDRNDTLSAYTADLSSIAGGSGSTLTGSNGITVTTGDTVELGGILNKSTTISGASQNLTFGDTNSTLNQFDVNSIESTQTYTAPTFNSVVVAYQPGLLTRTVSNTGSTETNVTVASSLQYRTDITKTSTNEHSWFNLQENDITLKAENTSTGAYTSSFISQNSYQLLHNNGSSVNNQLYMSDNNIILSHTSGGTTNGVMINEDMLYLYGPTTNLNLNTTGSTFTDTRAVTRGIEYNADYSSGYTSLSLITKGDLDSAITGVTDNFTTGTTLVGTILYFDTKNSLSAYTADLSSLGGGTGDTFVTSFTYDNANNITIGQNEGQPNRSVNISTMTGLTVNGTLSATTIDGNDILSGGTNLTSIFAPLGGGGEVNTASNIGGGEGLFSGKSGTDLQFKTLTSTGSSVTINSTGATVNIEVDNATDPNAIHDNVNSEISAIAAKTTLVDADIFLIEDTEASNAKKKTTLEDIKDAVGSATGGTPGIQTAVENFYIATANNQAATTGSQYSSKVIPLVNRTVNNMAYFVASASVGRTVYVGIYDNSGNKLAEGSGNTNTTGIQTATLNTSVTLVANTEYFFSILEGSGVPNFAQTSTFGIDKLARSLFISTTPTGLVASIAGHTAATSSFWLKAF